MMLHLPLLKNVLMPKRTAALEQPVVSRLIRNLRHLVSLMQDQFTSTLRVTDPTINCWENAPIQPSLLARKPIKVSLEEIALPPPQQNSEPGGLAACHYCSEALPDLRSADKHG